MAEDWKEVHLAKPFRLSLPERLTESPEQGIDSEVAAWHGPGITVRADHGPFSDPLTSYTNRPSYNERKELIDGRPARIISFDQPHGGHVAAVHLDTVEGTSPGKTAKLTVFVEASADVDRDIPLKIVRSLHSAEAQDG